MEMKLNPADAKSRRGPVAGVGLIAAGAAFGLLCSPAHARDFFGFGGGYYPRGYFYSSRPPANIYRDDYDGGPRVDRLKAQTAEKLKKAPVPPPTKGPLMVVVSLSKQQLTVYDQGVPLVHSKVSTGSRGHETPTGVFSVIQKSRWHRSNLYSDAPMPFMQRITWSGVALHAGVLPGYPASHGCIRMPEDFAIRLWRTTQMGARVIVAQGEVVPAEIAHSALFVKKAAPAVLPPVAGTEVVPPVSAAEASSLRPSLDAAPPARAGNAEIRVAEVSVVRPGQSADAAGVSAPAAGASTVTSATSMMREMPVPREAPILAAPQPTQPSTLAQTELPPAVTPPSGTLTPSQPSPVSPAPAATPERPLRPGPVSVFISRKERKLYVRKGFAPLFDVPVTIKDADQPIGTHVFTALAQEPDGEMFRWNVVTVPDAVRGDRRAETAAPLVHYAARRKHADKETMIDAPPPPSTEKAKAALDRVEMPADAVQRISELMSPGASLIISDEGLGPETGQETDFVVLTHDGPQAPPAKKKPRRRSYDDFD